MTRTRSLNLLVVLLILVMGVLTTQTNVAFADEPANDNPGNSIVVAQLPYHTTQDTTQAAPNFLTPAPPNIPDPTQFPTCGDNTPGYSHAVFYQWTATFTGAITVDTIGSQPKGTQTADYDAMHDVFTYTNGGVPVTPGTTGAWNEVTNSCSDDIIPGSAYTDSKSTLAVTSGMVYYIMVASDGTDTGNTPGGAPMALNIYPHDLEFSTNSVSFTTTEGMVMPSTQLGTFTDSDGDPCSSYTINVNWGDGILEDHIPCTGASATPSAIAGEAGGSLTAVNVTNGGSGYTTPPTVSFVGGGGSGATATAVLTNGVVTAVNLVTPGSGYSSAPTVVFSAPAGTPDLSAHCTTTSGETDCKLFGLHTYAEEGKYNVTVTVNDTTDGTTITSTAPSVATTQDAALSNLLNGPKQTTTQGTPATIYIGTFHDANPLCPTAASTPASSDDFTLANLNSPATVTGPGVPNSVYVDYGDGSTFDPASVSVVPSTPGHQPGACNFDVIGTHTYAPGAPGVNPVVATVTDNTQSVQLSTTLYLPNLATGSNGAFSVVEGQSFQSQLLGTFTDTNALCNQDDYSVSIDWADGSTQNIPAATNGIVLRLGNCTFGVYAPNGTNATAHTYVEEGVFHPTVSVTHGSSTAVLTPTITVTDAKLDGSAGGVNVVDGSTTASPVENTAFTGVVGNFADADPNCDVTQDYPSISINWGDGTPVDTTSGVVSQPTPGSCTNLQVTGTHTYKIPSASGYAVVVTVTDHTQSTQIKSNAIVVDATLDNPTGETFNATEGLPFTGQVLGFFHDNDPLCNVKNFSASIIWGDGTTSPATDSNHSIVDTGGGSCVFQVVAGHTYTAEGSLPYTVHVVDSSGQTTDINGSGNVGITDAALDVLKQGMTLKGTEGQPLDTNNRYLGTFHDEDPSCTAQDYTATVDWGTGSADTTSLSSVDHGIVAANDGGKCDFKVFGTFTYTKNGIYPIKVTVNDNGATPITLLDSATIADAALTAVSTASHSIVDLSTNQPITPVEGQMFTGQLLGTVTDADPNCDPNNFTVSINWGDGTGVDTTSGKVSQHPGTCVFDVLGSHAFAEETALPLNVVATIQDGTNSIAALGDNTTVADAPLTSTFNVLTPVEGLAFTNQLLGTVTDANSTCNYHDLTVTIEWADTPYPDKTTGFVQADPSNPCLFNVYGNHTFPEEGTFPVSVTVTDDGGSSTAFNVPTTVSDALLTAIPTPVKATEGMPWGTTAKPAVVGTFHDADPGCIVADYSLVSIDWGDSTGTDTTTGSIVKSADGKACDFDILGAHTYIAPIPAANGAVIVSTVHDTTGPINDTTTTISSPLTVLPSVLTEIKAPNGVKTTGLEGRTLSSQNGNVPVFLGTFTDSTPACNHSFSVSINWGDGTAAGTGSTAPSTHSLASCAFDVYGDHTYAEEDALTTAHKDIPYVITSTVTDAGGASVLVGAVASITDSPLVALFNLNPNTCTLLTSCDTSTAGFKPLAIFRDTSTTCASEADNAKPHYTAVLHWGDGTAPDHNTAVITPMTGSPCVFKVSGVHTYTTPGQYVVTTTITDEGGAPPITTNFNKGAPNSETASTLNVTIPPTTPHVGKLPAEVVAKYKHTIARGALGILTDYSIDLSVMQYQNGTYLGHLSLTDVDQNAPAGYTIPNCQLQGTFSCMLQILSFSTAYQPANSQAKVGTIYAKFTAPTGTRYVKIEVTDPDPSTADSVKLTFGGPINGKLPVSSSPPTAPTGAVTVVVS